MTIPSNSGQDSLADDIARAFSEAEHLHRYKICCSKYPRWVIERAFKAAQTFPSERIKKSRAAIFFYLVKQYAHKSPYNPGD
jgi:hypothetical protein